jgi:hypothetical protein
LGLIIEARQQHKQELKMTTTYTITGYEQDGICQHCGRTLKHCVKLGDGMIVGADCFDKKMTKAQMYQGKPFRLGSEKIRELAKVAEFWSASRRVLAGYHPERFNFQAA